MLRVLVLTLVLVTQFSGIAAAHGRFPATTGVVFHPTDDQMFVVRTTFGLLITRDGGERFDWICQGATETELNEDPALAVLPNGDLVLGQFGGLIRGEAACDFETPDPLVEETIIIDVAQDPDDPSVVYALESNGGRAPNSLVRSDDGAESFERVGEPIAPILFENVRVAPSDGDVIYLVGSYPPAEGEVRRVELYRSANRGADWQISDVALEEGDQNFFLLAVDPEDPDRLLARTRRDDMDRVLLSQDGGATFEEVARVAFVRGAAWEPGGSVWVGGIDDGGLWRSDDDGLSFAAVDDTLDIGCLSFHDGALFACTNNFSQGYALGRSTDGGETFERVLRFADVAGFLACDEDTSVAEACPAELVDLIEDLQLDIDPGTSDAGEDAGADAEVDADDDDGSMGGDAGEPDSGSDAGAPGGGEGCDCSIGSGKGADPRSPWALVLVMGGAIWWSRRLRKPR